MEDYRNPQPAEETSKIPTITLYVLIAVVAALLYAGYQSMKNDAAVSEELVSKRPNSVAMSNDNGADAVVIPPPFEETGKDDVAKDEKKDVEKSKGEPKKEEKKEEKKVSIPSGGETISHTVQTGETFFGIANRYHLSKSVLQALNPNVEPSGIKVGVTKLNVKVQTIHTVGPGDILRVVAKKYGISKQALMDANKKTKDMAERGEKLIIPIQ
ncbi:MAG: LysM peptidoglycan-binding domain-containing protein [Arcicella sp.]|nr:LysM peptidoglycan-binding domain-containing protein [Arcicella sp.]